jgi:ubiquinone/menaquinone biosynthesis C-methylase UbiE
MKNHKLWKSIAANWKYHYPPGRPGTEEQVVYEQFLNKALAGKSTKRVLVLGSTPEIRTILAKYPDIEVTILDRNIEMMLAMTELVEGDTSREVWIKGNWLSISFLESYFDVVMGDLVICNILRESQELFINQIKKFLKSDGAWVSRIYSVCNYTEFRTIAELLEVYECMETVGDFEISEFLRQAGITYWNSNTKQIELRKLGADLEEYLLEANFEKLTKKGQRLIRRTYELFAPFNIEFFIDEEKETDALLASHFVIKDKIENVDAAQFKEKGYFIYSLEKECKPDE